MNKFLKVFLSITSALLTVFVIFGLATWLILTPEERRGEIICVIPWLGEVQRNPKEECDCWYLDKDGLSKQTDMGLGCNAALSEDLIGSGLPRCENPSNLEKANK